MSLPRPENVYLPVEFVNCVEAKIQSMSGVSGVNRFVSPTLTDHCDAFLPSTGTTFVLSELTRPCVALLEPHCGLLTVLMSITFVVS